MSATGRKTRRVSVQAVAAIVVSTGFLTGAGIVLTRPSPPPAVTHIAYVDDASRTMHSADRCSDMERMAKEALNRAPGQVRFAVFTLGNKTTGDEPLRIGLTERKRGLVTIIEAREQRDASGPFLAEVKRLCSLIKPSEESPIFQGISSTVATMPTGICAQTQNHCEVIIRTDGIEEVDSVIRRRMKQPGSKESSRHGLPRINNTNITVAFCGLSARHLGAHRTFTPSRQVVEETFRREFTHPELVSFHPLCAPYTATSTTKENSNE